MSDTRAIPLREFARIVGPRVASRTIVRDGRQIVENTVEAGTEEEVWLKLLAIRHPNERHSVDTWRHFIQEYGKEEAHPSHPLFKRA